MMKVLYISSPSFFDLDLSFVKSLSSKVELYFFLELYPGLLNATALEIDDLKSNYGIYPAGEYSGLRKYRDYIDLEKTFAINRTSDHWYALSNFMLQIQLRALVNQIHPDVIHFNNHIYSNHFYLFLNSYSKLLINVHDPFPHSGECLGVKARLQRYLNNKLVKNHLLFNRQMKDRYVDENRLSSKNILISRLGVYEYFNMYLCEAVRPSMNILFFGRISPYKGIDDLLAAFKQVLKSIPNATLTIAGAGEIWFDVSSYDVPDENLQIVNRFISASELAVFMQKASIVVCPYRDATQSGVIMSAYAMNKAVIATRVGGLAEMVDDGVTGILVPPGESQRLADAIVNLLQDDAKRLAMEKNINESYYMGDRSWNTITDDLVAKYQLLD